MADLEVGVNITGKSSDAESFGKDIAKGMSKAPSLKKVAQEMASGLEKSLKGIGMKMGAGAGGAGAKAGGGLSAIAMAGANAATMAGKSLLTVIGGIISIVAILTSVDFLVKPIAAILKIMLLLFFLPVLPLLLLALKILVPFIRAWAKGAVKVVGFLQKIIDFFTGFFTGGGIIGLLAEILGIESFKQAWEKLKKLPSWLWNNIFVKGWEKIKDIGNLIFEEIIIPGWEILKGAGLWIWENVVMFGWNILKGAGLWIWNNMIKPGWDFMKTIGTKVWELIKAPFVWLRDKLKGIVDSIKRLNPFSKKEESTSAQDFILRPNGQLIKTDPQDTIIGFKGGFPGGGTNINITINNPSLNSKPDMDKFIRQLERRLQSSLRARTSYT